MFGSKKKKDAPKEEPVTTKFQEATGQEPTAAPTAPEAPEAPALSPAQQRAALLVQEFDANYNGIVTNAPDHVRACLQFATYGELYELVDAQHKTNLLLEKLIATIENMKE